MTTVETNETVEVNGQQLTKVKRGSRKKKNDAPVTVEGGVLATAVDGTQVLTAAAAEGYERSLARISQIIELKKDALKGSWNIGRLLFESMSTQDWKQHLDTDGRSKYRSFDKWTLEETGLHKAYAYDVMRVSQAFTEEEAGELGIKKCSIILQAPPETRAILLEKAKFTSKKDLEDEKTRANKGRKTTTRKGKEVVKAEGHGKTEKSKKQVAIVASLEPGSIPLYIQATDDSDEPVAAETIEQRPWGRIEFENGTGIEVQVVKLRSGQLKLNFVAYRKDD